MDVKVMKDKIHEIKGIKSFTEDMKDKIHELKGRKVFHRGYEGQNS